MIFEEPPAGARRVIGRGLVAVGLGLVLLIVGYFALNLLRLSDLLFVIFGAFALAIGATFTSLGLLIGGRALSTRRIGCISLVVFSVPTVAIFVFLVISLFSTAPPQPSSNSTLNRTWTRAA
jgi:hypothetical protein